MALRHRARPFEWIEISVGRETISLPNEIIKTYMPNLWRHKSGRLMARGNIDLERLVQGKTKNVRLALSIILKAIEASKTGHGVASELKLQLDDARDNLAMNHMDPERAMCTTFCNVVKLLEPDLALGRNDEMAYAASEWFTTFAAETSLHPRTVLQCVRVLDRLRTDITGPVLALLRCGVRQSHLHGWARRRFFRQSTLKKMRSLMRTRPREGLLVPSHGLIRGGDLDPEEVCYLLQHDPDAITIDLDRLNRLYDGGYTTDSDSEPEDDFYIPGHPLDGSHGIPIDHVGLGPHSGFPHPYERFMAPQPRRLPYQCQSPRLIEHDAIIARPGVPRKLKTWHNTVPHSIL